MKTIHFLAACFTAALISSTALGADWKFDFGSGPAAPGYTKVSSTTAYSPDTGYGFVDANGISDVDRKTADPLRSDFCTASGPFIFGLKLPEGNYNVTVYYGDPSADASTSIKAQARRLIMLETPTKAGQLESYTFTVNIRNPLISPGVSVGIKKGEEAVWGDKLSLEFNGKRPCVEGVDITEAKNAITVYLAGDSTVTDQAIEPWCGWGQNLPSFFQPGVAIANHACSGLALYSFESQRRLDKILSTIKAGDYLFIQFGHNDQKDKTPGAGPFTNYKDNLRHYVEAVRAKGGNPVLVTPMERRRWLNGMPQPTLADYAEAVRQIGYEQTVPVIDLNAMSLKFYTALGPDGSLKAFVHYPANTYPGQTAELKDDTHFNAYGAYELARCVVDGIRDQVPDLAKHLRSDVGGPFDPSKPDAPDAIAIPQSALKQVEKPAGS